MTCRLIIHIYLMSSNSCDVGTSVYISDKSHITTTCLQVWETTGILCECIIMGTSIVDTIIKVTKRHCWDTKHKHIVTSMQIASILDMWLNMISRNVIRFIYFTHKIWPFFRTLKPHNFLIIGYNCLNVFNKATCGI